MNIRTKALLYTALIILIPVVGFFLLLSASKEIIIGAAIIGIAVLAYIVYTIVHTQLDYDDHIKNIDKTL